MSFQTVIPDDQNFNQFKEGGGMGGDVLCTPSPYEQVLSLLNPCFIMFLEEFFNDQESFTVTSSPIKIMMQGTIDR